MLRNPPERKALNRYFIRTKKTIQNTAADVGMMFTTFNLRRIIYLLPQNVLHAQLKGLGRIFGFINAMLQASGFDMPNASPSRTIVRIIFVTRLQPAEMRYIR